MTKTFWCVFSVHSSNCCSLAKRECSVSQGRVETLFGWGKNVYTSVWQIYSGHYAPNFIKIGRVLYTVYRNNILVFFRFTF